MLCNVNETFQCKAVSILMFSGLWRSKLFKKVIVIQSELQQDDEKNKKNVVYRIKDFGLDCWLSIFSGSA